MSDKRPAYQWYPKDYLADEHVALMTLEQEGAYRRLLDYCWLHKSIPADIERLALLCRVSGEKMAVLWQGVSECFILEGDRYVNGRLKRERKKQDAFKKAKSEAGKKGAKAKHSKGKDGSATVSPQANPSLSSPFASSSSSPVTTSPSLSTREVGVETEAGGKGFYEFWAIGGKGPLLTCERAYYDHVPRHIEHTDLVKAFTAYKSKLDGAHEMNTANWIAQKGYADTTLFTEKASGKDSYFDEVPHAD